MIKICFISPSFPYMNCGVGDYTVELVRALKKYDLDIEVITLANEKVMQFNKNLPEFRLCPIVKKWDFSNISCILEEVRNFKPDIIHIQYHWGSTGDGFIIKGLMVVFLPLILRISKIKSSIISTLHSRMTGPYLFKKAGFLRQWALIPLLLFSDRIVVTNKFDGKTLSKWLPFLKNKISFIAGGTGHYLCDNNLKEEALKIRAQLKNSDDEIVLSNFGFMVPYKGIEELLEALSLLREKGYRLRLLAIGGSDTDFGLAGSYFDKLQKKAKILKIEPYINWLGFRDPKEVSLYLLASDICAMPFRDGASEWRSSFLDALSHGLPIITTYTERTPEEIIDKNSCILVSPQDSVRLAEAIEKLINSPSLRESLGKSARKLYEKEYDWPVIALKTLNAYKSQLKNANDN